MLNIYQILHSLTLYPTNCSPIIYFELKFLCVAITVIASQETTSYLSVSHELKNYGTYTILKYFKEKYKLSLG